MLHQKTFFQTIVFRNFDHTNGTQIHFPNAKHMEPLGSASVSDNVTNTWIISCFGILRWHASIATSLVACFIQLICLMSRPMRTMLRMTKYKKRMNQPQTQKRKQQVWEFPVGVRILRWTRRSRIQKKCSLFKLVLKFLRLGLRWYIYIYILLTSITSVLPYVPGSSYIVTLFMVHTGSPGILTKMDQSMAWKFIPNGVMTIPDTGRQSN